MSAIGRTARTRRQAPILVRAGLSTEVVEELAGNLLPRSARVVATLYDAMCDTGSPTASSQISAVLMGLPATEGEEQAIVDAFRRTDPSVRLVLLLNANDADRAVNALRVGFDDAVALPASQSRLQQAIEPNTDGSSRSPNSEPRQETQSSDQPGSEQTTATQRSIVEIVLEDAWARLAQEKLLDTQEATPTIAEFSGTGDLGDTDLVRAVIDGTAVEEIALELIRRHTSIPSLDFSLHAPDLTPETRPEIGQEIPNPIQTCLPVEAPEGVFGYLTSEGDDAVELAPWARWLSCWLLLQTQHAQLRRMAWTDDLTGAGNRRALYHVLDKVIDRARQNRRAVTVMSFDIDNFKRYNDQFGHDAGDQVLRETVQLLRSVIRRGDHVFSIGGDEFVVIFADPSGPRSARSSPPESIEQIAARFQQQVGTLQLPQIGLNAPGTLSISAGMVTYPWDGATSEELLRRADQLALESKRSGKNVITFGPAARNRPTDLDDS